MATETPALSLKCRLCDFSYTNKLDVIDMFSEDGKKKNIAPKILYTLAILITENDSGSKYVCKVCLRHINIYVRFTAKCRVNNFNFINSLNSPFKEELRKVMNVSIQSLYYNKHHLDLVGVYDSLITYMKRTESNKTSSHNKPEYAYFDELVLRNCDNSNSLRNNMFTVNNNLGISIRKTDPVNLPSDLTPSSSVPAEVPSTNNSLGQKKGDKLNSGPNKNVSINQNGILIGTLKNKLQFCLLGKQSTSQNKTTTDTNSKNINKIGSNSNGLIVKNTNIDHDYSSRNKIQSSVNGVIDDNEVICLDDDNEDDVSNNISNDVHPLNQWIITNDVSKKTYPPKVSVKKKSQNMHFNRRMVHLDQNVHLPPVTSQSSDTSSEFVTVTPDITLPTMNPVETINQLNQTNNLYYVIPSQHCAREEPTESSLVTPETGFHFLFTSEQTVDLTDESQKEKQDYARNKRKSKKIDPKSVPSKKVCTRPQDISKIINQLPLPPSPLSLPPPLPLPQSSSSQQSSSQQQSRKTILNEKSTLLGPIPRSNRSSTTVAVNSALKNPSVYKLGTHRETEHWSVILHKIKIPLYQCPICDKIFSNIVAREKHEKIEHRLPPDSTDVTIDSVCTLENATNTEQQEFLIYLNLVKRMSLKTQVADQLANRTHLLKALKKFGNVLGSYNCHFCEYKTSRVFILWAHMSYNHVEFDSDKKSNTFCFLCDRVLSKRTNLLKHLDRCAMKPLEDNETSGSSTVEKLACNYCDVKISSLSHLERHLWNHVPT